MSEKRQPSARITSALRAASVAGYSPQQPAMPRWSGMAGRERALAHEGGVDGDVHVLGELARARGSPRRGSRRRRRGSAAASPSAACSSARATASGEPGVRQLSICERSSGSGTSTSAVRIQRSYGTSMCTGPGRPVRASLNAFGRNLPRSSTLCAWKLRFVDHLRDAREVGLVVAVLLLQRARVVLVRRHLAGDRDERGRVVERVAHRDGQQHRARAPSRCRRGSPVPDARKYASAM